MSKLCRADEIDLGDIAYLVRREALSPGAVRDAMARALVPAAFRDVYPQSCAKVEALLQDR